MKRLCKILGMLICLLIICFLFVYLKFNFVLGKILSSHFKAKVQIEKVYFDRPEIEIVDFTIQNPEGFASSKALKIDDIDITAPYQNYFKKVIRIKTIDVKNIEINIEFKSEKDSNSNWISLLENISSSPNDEKYHSEKTKNTTKGRYAIIDLLVIQNLKINIFKGGKKTETKEFKNVQFKNLVTKKGAIVRRVTQVILYHMIFNVKNLFTLPFDIGKKITKDTFFFIEKLLPFGSDKSNEDDSDNSKNSENTNNKGQTNAPPQKS